MILPAAQTTFWEEQSLWDAVDTDRLVIADGVDLRTKHHSCESEEEDGFKAEEDQE